MGFKVEVEAFEVNCSKPYLGFRVCLLSHHTSEFCSKAILRPRRAGLGPVKLTCSCLYE